ncbi:Pfam:DUF88 [Seminavis robusta]|uniref:Pfam:DUF88 n=1 Tax=Seminavis robusta TaxID=568900 RepID=A0A9N8HN28_9STRA|nr:Pfam:DUF88 [Seminavis robusta]|eukprot:Sro951_g223980.1 Pfam:DUF88 (710) ;mRNA; r:37337-39540
MDSFEEWVKTADYPCFREWGEKAVALGASWDSFRREDKNAIVEDLITGGIPILTARDMVAIATKEVDKSKSPMAIFWDLENMPVPTDTSGRDITTSLKSILAPHGDLIQFRGYASIGLNNIPQEKRSDLQLSGCHLVDCPHHGRKEVADKMIIVDAMHFAFQHPECATLCFITGDVDYAYLLATLQRPQWRTIVISRGTMQSMLHVNSDMKMRWETDILQPIYGRITPETQSVEESSQSKASFTNAWDKPFRPLPADEAWKDDVELLHTVLKAASQKSGTLAPLKSAIGIALRSTNPGRFPQRISIQNFLARAIDEGVVIENGDGALKTLCLPLHAGHPTTIPALSLSKKLPSGLQSFPPKVLDAASKAPFIVLLRKMHCPPNKTPPSKAFIQSSPDWLFYMFPTQATALDAASDHRWLSQGTFIDIRQIPPPLMQEITIPDQHATTSRSGNGATMRKCGPCGAMAPQSDGFFSDCGTQFFCSGECRDWIHEDAGTKERGVDLVVETLEFLANCDDLYCQMTMLGKLLTQRYPSLCTSRRLTKLWILHAENSKRVFTYKVTKQKFAALPRFRKLMLECGQDEKISTAVEEEFVYNLLWEGTGSYIDRKIVNRRLQESFASMQKPTFRQQVFANAKAKDRFFLAKGPLNQTVGLSKAAAEAGLETSSAPTSPVKLASTESGAKSPDEVFDHDSDSSDDEPDLLRLVASRK